MGESNGPGNGRRYAARVRSILEESARVKRELALGSADSIAQAAELLIDAFRRGSKALLFGNGGSAADAQHIAGEWTGRLHRDRPPLPAIALSVNTSDLTCIANDYGFEQVFSRLVEAHGRAGDVAVAISTSGNSRNVVEAVRVARDRELATVGLLGKGGGELASLVDLAIVVPSEDTQRIQESHIAIGHVLCELVDEALFPPA